MNKYKCEGMNLHCGAAEHWQSMWSLRHWSSEGHMHGVIGYTFCCALKHWSIE